ncbi:MAG TPA: hypothetical protein VG838_17325 [Opitutaceae bacterium]|nr:hypothetical protein [Opitutaceae bacterium]
MKQSLVFLVLSLAAAAGARGAADAPAPGPSPTAEAPAQPSEAEKIVQDLVARQQALFAEAAKRDANFDENEYRTAMQDIGNAYDDFLRKRPDYGPAYAAYGVMLGKIGMRRQSSMMLLKADELFLRDDGKPGVRTPGFLRTWALVKNQLGNFVAEEGRPLEAVNYFLSAIDLTPNEPLYHYQLGTLLTEARDDFLGSGHWTRAALDEAMQRAFKRAAELAPDRIELGYRYAESFADVEKPDWDAALKAWAALEEKAKSDFDRQAMRLQAANILIQQKKYDEARVLIATVTVEQLQSSKQKLVAAMAETTSPAPAR